MSAIVVPFTELLLQEIKSASDTNMKTPSNQRNLIAIVLPVRSRAAEAAETP
jgi:hypothetical protein